MTGRVRVVAAIAGASAIAFSVTIYVIAGAADSFEPPDAASRGLASAVLLGVPGVIGLLAVWMERRTVLVAAGVLCLFESAISFSYVTLVYLLPAMAFLHAATQGPEASIRPPIRPVRLLLAAVVAVPIALVIVLRIGVLGIIALALIAGLASSRSRGRGAPGLTAGEAARGVAIVLVVIGAWAASFVFAETACWIGHAAPDGGIVWERIPPTDTFTVGPGDVAGHCAGGTLTSVGVAVAGGLLLAALGAAALPLPGGMFRPRSIRSRPGSP